MPAEEGVGGLRVVILDDGTRDRPEKARLPAIGVLGDEAADMRSYACGVVMETAGYGDAGVGIASLADMGDAGRLYQVWGSACCVACRSRTQFHREENGSRCVPVVAVSMPGGRNGWPSMTMATCLIMPSAVESLHAELVLSRLRVTVSDASGAERNDTA